MYQRLYFILFNAITDALEQMELQNFEEAFSTLESAQRYAEELYISGGEFGNMQSEK